jgi:hypothetical protein
MEIESSNDKKMKWIVFLVVLLLIISAIMFSMPAISSPGSSNALNNCPPGSGSSNNCPPSSSVSGQQCCPMP